VTTRLVAAGWRILGRQVRVGRDELDIVAVDPGSPGRTAELVFVEVRSSRTGRFGVPEESVTGRKIARTWRAALALVRAGTLPDGTRLPRIAWRVDLVSVELGPSLGRDAPGTRVRHLERVGID
jgi:putative endonuclease